MATVVTHIRRLLPIAAVLGAAAFAAEGDRYDAEIALQLSQQAIGNTIGDYALLDQYGQTVNLRSELAGKPVVVSMIFTSCHHVCPATTKHLAKAVESAREALGEDSFEVVSIGFDVANDSPQAMAAFARRQNVSDDDKWRFLSATSGNNRAD